MSSTWALPPDFENHDPNDPRQFAAWALTHFPDTREAVVKAAPQGRMPMVGVPKPGVTAPAHSDLLWQLGYRHHPDLMTLYPLPGEPSGIGGSWADAPRYVPKAEYDAYWAARDGQRPSMDEHVDAAAANALRRILGEIAPDALERIDSMTAEQRAAALPDAEAQAVPAFERLQQLRDRMNRRPTDGDS